MTESGGGTAPVPPRAPKPLVRLAAVCAVSTLAALAIYASYRHLFPYRGARQGVCIVCGAQTMLGRLGWADFCPRHQPLTPVPPLMVVAEGVSLFFSAISGWLLLRRFAHWGGRTVSLGLVLLCLAAMAAYVSLATHPLYMVHHFMIALFLLIYTFTAAYVDSMESLLMVIVGAVGISALLAFSIQFFRWLVIGYWGFFS